MSDTNSNPDTERKVDGAVSALADLCEDYAELDGLAHLLATYPSSYRLGKRLTGLLSMVGSRLWDLHDDAVK